MIYAENILICIAVPLAISALYVKGTARRFVISFLIGMITCLLAAYIGGFFKLTSGLSNDDTSVYISPVVEEILKLLPILFFINVFELNSKEVMLTAVSLGTGFATFENCCYILSSSAQNLSLILIRGAAVGVMHIVSMVTLAMALHILKRVRIFSFAGILGALSFSMTFHAFYNLLVSEPGIPSYLGYASPLICAVLLYFIDRKLKLIEE